MPCKLSCLFAGTLALLLLAGCAGAATPGAANVTSPTPQSSDSVNTPVASPSASAGESLFNVKCAVCHGERAVGTETGPPLVHRVYEPGHHPDFAFHNAVNNGVMSHHWPFGDMPPVPNLSEEDVDNIICYVRGLQRAEGIFVKESC